MTDCDNTPLRAAALIEGTTLLLLVGVAVPLRHLAGWTLATTIMGPVHGMAFLAFGWLTIAGLAEGRVSRREGLAMLAGACIPFGGFLTARWLARLATSR